LVNQGLLWSILETNLSIHFQTSNKNPRIGIPAFCQIFPAFFPRIGIAIGSLTFTGSVVAAGKLHELIPGKPIVLPQRWLLNAAALAGSAVMTGDSRKIPGNFGGFL
jgi:hypothetical protein